VVGKLVDLEETFDMPRVAVFLLALIAIGGLSLSVMADEPAQDAAGDEATPEASSSEGTSPETVATPATPKKTLSPKLAALRNRVRRAVEIQYDQPFTTYGNTAADVMHFCLPFGAKTRVHAGDAYGKQYSAIGCLCYNYSFGGYRPLTVIDGRVAARIGYGLQAHPSQMLALLAQSRVPATYGVRVDKKAYIVADLIEYEKRSCRSGTDMSMKLIGLAYYVKDDGTWKNDRDEQWSIERIVREEMGSELSESGCGGTHRLMGLSRALQHRRDREQPIGGQFLRAEKYLAWFQQYALRNQNDDGSFNRRFFAAKGRTRDSAAALRSTGHILEWLAYSLPEDQLDDPRVVKSVEFVTALLETERYTYDVPSLPAREIAAAMHAVSALTIYDRRLFKPADPPKKKPGERTAERP